MNDADREIIRQAIGDHLREVGPQGWDAVRERFPTVSRATFFRIVKEVREAPGPELVKKAAKTIKKRAAKKRAAATRSAKKQAGQEPRSDAVSSPKPPADRPTPAAIYPSAAGELLPHPPPPSALVADGPKVQQALDFMEHFRQMLDDAALARADALATDADGNTVIRPLRAGDFMTTIKLRSDLWERAIKAMGTVYDLQRAQEFRDIIIEEIGRASPDVAAAILERLQEANSRHGITMTGF